jgi:uncharacterized membrane protein HdeD (DUF308 family)
MVAGCVTLLLAAVAFFLPEIDWAPTGGIVGWLLLVAGAAEFAFGTRRGADYLGTAAMTSGALTAAAGLIFITNPFAGYFPVANVVTVWLLVRGAMVLAIALGAFQSRIGRWLALSGGADLLLGGALLAGLSTSLLVVSLFGATREIVARFSLILAASFLITGLAQIAIALLKQRQSERI